jgi:hypothetical protein
LIFCFCDVLYITRPVEFYVYNSDTDEVRVAIIMPSDQWGGQGILGNFVSNFNST